MNTSTISTRILLGCIWLVAALTTHICHAGIWTPIYQEDFSSDPGWTTDDPAKLGWDQATQTFHGVQVNTEGTFAYTNISSFDPASSWRLEFDARMNSDGWSAGMDFGLFDPGLSISAGSASIHQGIGDGGRGIALYGYGPVAGAIFNPAWSFGTWYHHIMEYDANTNLLTLQMTERATGSTFMDLSITPAPFPADMTRLGVSRLHMKNATAGVNPAATADYNLDNISLSVIPEPATLLLCLLGA